jgi:hypothetical protein
MIVDDKPRIEVIFDVVSGKYEREASIKNSPPGESGGDSLFYGCPIFGSSALEFFVSFHITSN